MNSKQTMTRHGLPEGIGPHEGRELELMLAGKKPLAMFSDIIPSSYQWPDEFFEPHVASGKLIKKEFLSETPDGEHQVRDLYFALPGEGWRIEKAHHLSGLRFDTWRKQAALTCVELGRLLGYREDDIRAFISWMNENQAL